MSEPRIRRTRTRSTEQEEAPEVVSNRRVRVRGSEVKEKTVAVSRLDSLLKSVSECDAQISSATARKEKALEEIKVLLIKQRIEMYRFENIKAERYTPPIRHTNVIDPKKFHDACENEKDFYSAVTVGVTKAKTILPMKTLDKMTTSVPSSPGKETIKITYEEN